MSCTIVTEWCEFNNPVGLFYLQLLVVSHFTVKELVSARGKWKTNVIHTGVGFQQAGKKWKQQNMFTQTTLNF